MNILREMICGFYDTNVLDHELWNHPEVNMKWSPAEVQQILFRNFEDPQNAMTELLVNQPQKTEQTETTTISEVPQEQTSQLSTRLFLPTMEKE